MPEPLKTRASEADVAAFLDAVEPPRRRAEGWRLHAILSEVSGFPARMWGASIVGFGRYDYAPRSGPAASWFATGFSPRKAAAVVYIMPGYTDFDAILGRLGPHRKGKACLYLPRLDRIDEGVLRELVRAGLDDLARQHPVTAG